MQEQIIPISESGELVYTQWDQLTQISKQIMNAGITKLGNPVQINLIILKGKKLGLDIFEALENISVINNKTTISGALASALVDRSGLLNDRSHIYEGEGDDRKCTAVVQRKGRSGSSFSFSIKEAKTAGLYPGKPSSGWHSYPDSMLYWRAMGFCYRREFSDVLQGMYLTEEIIDEVNEVKVVTDAPPITVGRGVQGSIPATDGASVPRQEPFVPDPEDPHSHEHPLISEPSMVLSPEDDPLSNIDISEVGKMIQGRPPKLEALIELSKRDGITNIELVKVVNGLRLFPRGMEHQLSSLPEAKMETLIKNWEVVIRQVARMRNAEKSAGEEATTE